MLGFALLGVTLSKSVVDFLVRASRSNANGSTNAVSCFAFVARLSATTIVIDKSHINLHD
jgi:hypothetical protein